MKERIVTIICFIIAAVILTGVAFGKIDPNGAVYHLGLITLIFGAAFAWEKVKV